MTVPPEDQSACDTRALVERLKLQRPLVFLDLESTGTSVSSDRIVEIALLRLHPDGREQFLCRRVNPGMPIPAEATAIHGISDADVRTEPPFASYAKSLLEFLGSCDFAGFAIARFDLPLLQAEFARAGLEFGWRDCAVIDAMGIFHAKEPRDLTAAARFYCGRDLCGAHSAEEDLRATVAVLRAQLERYEDLPDCVGELNEFCNPRNPNWVDDGGKFIWVNGVATVGFGKYKGTPLQRLAGEDPDYLEWILKQDFSPEVMQIVRDSLSGRFPQAPAGSG
jgi:DNA polymerase-3 subunit epsilon